MNDTFFEQLTNSIASTISSSGLFIIVAILVVIITSVISGYLEQRTTEEKVERAEKAIKAEPEKAKPAWDLARLTLDSYFNRNLGQIRAIFWISLLVMGAGFVFSIWSISQAVQKPDVLLPAAIATLLGLITEFIGATFLFVYRSTVQQALVYMKSLERINSVGMAMQILDTMPDSVIDGDLKTQTKAKLVMVLMQKAMTEEVSTPPDAPTNG